MDGKVEEVRDELADRIKRMEAEIEAMKTALARILFTPACY
jgi:hypothetical protein